MTTLRQTIAELLSREMETRNWSQREMAKACTLSNTTISKIVRGQSMPDPNTCFKLAQGLELPIHYVLELAGHEIAGAQQAAPSLEAFLHARFAHLPDRAIQEMVGAIRTIEHTYTTPTSQDLEAAQQKLAQAEFVRRWLDPVKRKVLTVVQGGHFLFYQTADLDTNGQEYNRSELQPIQEDLSELSMFPVYNFANSFCVQLYPLAEFDAHRCQAHQQHVTLFTPIYAGDRGAGVLVIYPDGTQVTIRDQVMEQVWQKIYADLTAGQDLLPLSPSARQQEKLAQVQERWQTGDADELWINPDAQTYAAYFAPLKGDTTYYLVTGSLDEVGETGWKARSAERIEIIDTGLYGRFETSVVHLQGFCIRVYPHVEHITATRHIVPSHQVLIWSQDQETHILVFNEYLGTWLRLHITKVEGTTQIEVAEDRVIRAQVGLREFELERHKLETDQIPFIDSRSPY